MAIKAGGSDEPGLGREPPSVWMADDGLSIECPFCGVEQQSDNELGQHLVYNHWREIDFATKRVRDMNCRQRN